ncbi:KdsC family phosphatase [Phaeodactylibacter luteus]|uniref:HAD-IIIA family hydrolase n=1 Tax=Phaeodactylibacter luteus TaxID=1564516 RepID=A0A5C6RIN7_9BACT|nr:HAD-IIIA family hydrolase [Phaeodactylibacter luteus]TXB61983.1 HAD-IIIA family hydrolase [Phaeodactylibacter luteus]
MNQLEQFRDVETFIFDVDGVLTNNQLLVTEAGELLRSMNVRDGYALKRAVQAGYQVAIITGGSSAGVAKRLQGLGITEIYSGISNKVEAYEDYIDRLGLDEGKILYMGDDMPDLPVMRRVWVPTCPSDAAPELFEAATYISPQPGGSGCARDVIEKVLKLNGDW